MKFIPVNPHRGLSNHLSFFLPHVEYTKFLATKTVDLLILLFCCMIFIRLYKQTPVCAINENLV